MSADKPILTEKNIQEREKFESYTGKSILIRTFCVGSESGHPIYLTALRGTLLSVYAPYHQFKAYRDLSFQLADVGINSDFLDGPFPPSYGKSKLGIKLTEEELENRQFLLDVWVRRVFLKYSLCSEKVRQIIEEFFGLKELTDNSKTILEK